MHHPYWMMFWIGWLTASTAIAIVSYIGMRVHRRGK